MKIIKLKKIDSTQDYLKKILESQPSEQDYLVITEKQTHGIGRHGNQWEHISDSLACSFTLAPNPTLTLSSIEIAVLITEYFQQKHNFTLQLKWPNDLFYQGKKCGGILIHIHNNQLIVGLGVNALGDEFQQVDMRTGLNSDYLDAERIVQFIHDNRIQDDSSLKKQWLDHCLHLNKKVNAGNKTGLFIGLGDYGEAIIENEQGIDKVISGSLRCLFL